MTEPISNVAHILPLDAETRYGRVQAVGWTGGERYYWLVDRCGVVSMMPAVEVETKR